MNSLFTSLFSRINRRVITVPISTRINGTAPILDSKFLVFKRNEQDNTIEVPLNSYNSFLEQYSDNKNFKYLASIIDINRSSYSRKLTENSIFESLPRSLSRSPILRYKGELGNPRLNIGDFGVFTEYYDPLFLIVFTVDCTSHRIKTIKFKYDISLFTDQNDTNKLLISKLYTPLIKDLAVPSVGYIDSVRFTTDSQFVEIEICDLSKYVETGTENFDDSHVLLQRYLADVSEDSDIVPLADVHIGTLVKTAILADDISERLEQEYDGDNIYQIVLVKK